jgi:23S rRNA pseudouridine2605 synthase
MITDGRVALDGAPLTTPATVLASLKGVTVDGKPVTQAEGTRLWLFHKPSGFLTTARDPKGRPTLFDLLPDDLPRVVTVGRLDMTTEGLLLLTNDGELARWLELPKNEQQRLYRVRVHGRLNVPALESLAEGVTIDGVRYGSVIVDVETVRGSNAWLTVRIHEGKNREVRRVMEHLGLQVARLMRVGFGPFGLGDLEEVPPEALAKLLPKAPMTAARSAQAKSAGPPRGPSRGPSGGPSRGPSRGPGRGGPRGAGRSSPVGGPPKGPGKHAHRRGRVA